MVNEVRGDNFVNEVLESDLPVLVDFGAEWCPPCKMMKPVVDELAKQYEGKLRIVTMDTDQYPDVMTQYGVMGLPTFILFDGGQPVKRIIGYTPRQKMEAQLAPHLR
jgi:thioredoxin 1